MVCLFVKIRSNKIDLKIVNTSRAAIVKTRSEAQTKVFRDMYRCFFIICCSSCYRITSCLQSVVSVSCYVKAPRNEVITEEKCLEVRT
jgi:hypothetical protein